MIYDWYYASNGERHGPVSAQKLKELADLGYLDPTDYVWKEGMADWVLATKVKGLFPNATESKPPPTPTPKVQPQREIPVTIKTDVPVRVVAPREGKAQKIAKWITIGWSLFCLLGICVGIVNVASNTRPSYSEYQEAGQAVGVGCGFVIWFFIWAAISVPSLVIWLLTRKT